MTATNRNGHKPKRPQSETAKNRNCHKPKRAQTDTKNGHRPKRNRQGRPQTFIYYLRNSHHAIAAVIVLIDWQYAGLWPFLIVAVSVLGRSGLWPCRFVAVPVCGRSGLWPFRFLAVPVCGHFGLWPFRFWRRIGLWPLWPETHTLAWFFLCGALVVVISGISGCRYDSLQCHQLRQNWHHDNSWFSMTHINMLYDKWHLRN